MTAAILIALLVTGGTTYAAQGAVPGDFLYAVKVEVNENVRSAFALSNDAEATLQLEFAEERLKEAEALAQKGKLNSNTSAELKARLAKHYEEVEKRSEREKDEGDFETSAVLRASLEGTLRSHADVLSALSLDDKNESDDLIVDIESYADAQAEAQATATAEVSEGVRTNVQSTIVRASNVIDKVKRELTRVESELEAATYARINAHIEEAASVKADAEAAFEAGLYQEAYGYVQKAIRLAHEAKALLDSALRLEIDLDASLERLLQVETRGDVEVNGRSDEKREEERNEEREEKKDRGVELETEVDLETSVDDLIEVEANSNSNLRLGL